MNLLIFDFGGTSIKYGIWTNDQIAETSSFPTPSSWDELTPQLLSIKNDFAARYELTGAAFSFPGAVDSAGGIIHGISAIDYIHHFPIVEALEKLLELPVSMANDANCAALAELWKGAAKDVDNSLFVVLGTGVGGVVIFDRKIHYGKHFFGGEFGVMELEPGKSFSEMGTAVNMATRYCERLNVPKGTYSGKEVFELAKSGNQDAMEEVDTFYKYTALGLYNLQVSIDPDRIVIGGGLSANDEVIQRLSSTVTQMLEDKNLAYIKPDIVPCVYRNDANLLGAVKQFLDTKL